GFVLPVRCETPAGMDLRRAAAIYSLIGTAKLNGINPQAYLREVLVRIADHLPQSKVVRSFRLQPLGWPCHCFPSLWSDSKLLQSDQGVCAPFVRLPRSGLLGLFRICFGECLIAAPHDPEGLCAEGRRGLIHKRVVGISRTMAEGF